MSFVAYVVLTSANKSSLIVDKSCVNLSTKKLSLPHRNSITSSMTTDFLLEIILYFQKIDNTTIAQNSGVDL